MTIRHLQHAPHVAQHAARLQRPECDDLGDAVAAVAFLNIRDDFIAPVLAEIDIEVGHRHAFGIEEALEQEAEAHRVEIGNGERIGDEGARARAAARPDRDIVCLRPLDEIGYDEEVSGIFHPLDHFELERQSIAVFLDAAADGGAVRFDALLQPGSRTVAQFRSLIDCVTALQPRRSAATSAPAHAAGTRSALRSRRSRRSLREDLQTIRSFPPGS